MSYFLADANGFVRDFASGGGLDRLHAWSKRADPVVQQFFKLGGTLEPKQLAAALRRSMGTVLEPMTREMVDALIDTAMTASAPLVVSDGTSGDDDFRADPDDLRAAIGNGNNQYRHDAGGKSEQPSKGAAHRAVAKLPKLSHNDSEFRAIPIKQATDKQAEVIDYVELKDQSANAETVQYDPSKDPDLLSTQDYVEQTKLNELINDYEKWADKPIGNVKAALKDENGPPIIVKFQGKTLIADGHHRIVAAKLLKKKLNVIRVRVK